MGAASVVSLEEVRETRLHAEARQRLHECFDRWLDGVEERMKDTPRTLEQAVFPSAVQIVDYDHGCEPLDKVAALPYGGHPERPHEWCEAAVARLFWGEGHGVIWGLQRMKPKDTLAADAIATLLGDLQRHQDRVDYQFARKGGYPMGSGGIESANTCLCHVRLKRSGAWWYVDNANQRLALRCAKYHGTFDRVFEAYRHKAKQCHDKGSRKK